MHPQQGCVRLANQDWPAKGPVNLLWAVSTFHMERPYIIDGSAATPTVSRNYHNFVTTLLTHLCMPTDYHLTIMCTSPSLSCPYLCSFLLLSVFSPESAPPSLSYRGYLGLMCTFFCTYNRSCFYFYCLHFPCILGKIYPL